MKKMMMKMRRKRNKKRMLLIIREKIKIGNYKTTIQSNLNIINIKTKKKVTKIKKMMNKMTKKKMMMMKKKKMMMILIRIKINKIIKITSLFLRKKLNKNKK
jgi:hypothetical protein